MRVTGKKWWVSILVGLAMVVTLPFAGLAQNARLQLKSLEKLEGKAAEVTDVTLDWETMQIFPRFISGDHDPEAAHLKQLMKDLKGIYVKDFEFDGPDQYSPADVEAIRSQLAGPAWSRIIESRNISNRENAEIYVMKDGDKIGGMAILVADPKELTVVNIVGSLELDKLSSLDGNFGIHLQRREHKNQRTEEKQHDKL